MMNFEQEAYTQYQTAYTLANADLKDKKKQHLSIPTDFQDAKLYFDFLLQYRYTKLRQFRFTQPGFLKSFKSH